MNKIAPVHPGQKVELAVTGITHDAEGVARFQGFTIFVPGALPGDTVLAEVISTKKQYGRALPVKIMERSSERVLPPCPYYNDCGGCQLMHAAYAAQLRYKEEQVVSALRRIGGLTDVSVEPIIGVSQPEYYRNKAQFPVGVVRGNFVAGCYERRSHNIVDVQDCLIQERANNEALLAARKTVVTHNVSIYDERLHEGLLRSIMVRNSAATGETMVVFVINGDELPAAQVIAEELAKAIPALVSFQLNINKKPGNVLLGAHTRLVGGRDYILDELDGLKFKVSARSFYQVNSEQTKVLYQKAREYAGLTGSQEVLDLYCGVGTIALFMAGQAKRVIGVEISPDAVDDAKANALLNSMDNVEFILGAAEAVVPGLVKQGYAPDVCIVDPPRAGCDEKLLETLVQANPARIVYISCNPATLARDLKYLVEHGFAVSEVQPVDMFPHTVHVETVVLMSRDEAGKD